MDDAIVARKDDFGENLRNTFASCKEIGKARIWAEAPIQFGSFMKELSKEKFVLHHADESGKFTNLYLCLNEETECKIPSYRALNNEIMTPSLGLGKEKKTQVTFHLRTPKSFQDLLNTIIFHQICPWNVLPQH